MTTTCEEKPTANFTREVGDQSLVSIGVLMFVMVFITVTDMVEWEFIVYARTCRLRGLFVYLPGRQKTSTVLRDKVFLVIWILWILRLFI